MCCACCIVLTCMAMLMGQDADAIMLGSNWNGLGSQTCLRMSLCLSLPGCPPARLLPLPPPYRRWAPATWSRARAWWRAATCRARRASSLACPWRPAPLWRTCRCVVAWGKRAATCGWLVMGTVHWHASCLLSLPRRHHKTCVASPQPAPHHPTFPAGPAGRGAGQPAAPGPRVPGRQHRGRVLVRGAAGGGGRGCARGKGSLRWSHSELGWIERCAMVGECTMHEETTQGIGRQSCVTLLCPQLNPSPSAECPHPCPCRQVGAGPVGGQRRRRAAGEGGDERHAALLPL